MKSYLKINIGLAILHIGGRLEDCDSTHHYQGIQVGNCVIDFELMVDWSQSLMKLPTCKHTSEEAIPLSNSIIIIIIIFCI